MAYEILNKELNYIKDPRYKGITEFILDRSPRYFYEVPSSSTGRYHSLVDQGKGGLVRHIKVAVAVALDSFNLECFSFNDKEKDLILMSVILHDIYKCGANPTTDQLTGSKTDFEHPRLAANFIKECNSFLLAKNLPHLEEEELNFVYGCVASHMGQWSKQEGHEDLPRPITTAQKCVSNADYYGSRRLYDAFYLDLLKEHKYQDLNIDPNTNALLDSNHYEK